MFFSYIFLLTYILCYADCIFIDPLLSRDDNLISSGLRSTTTHDFLYRALANSSSFTSSEGSFISHSLKKVNNIVRFQTIIKYVNLLLISYYSFAAIVHNTKLMFIQELNLKILYWFNFYYNNVKKLCLFVYDIVVENLE